MARTKKSHRDLEKETRRTTLTKFRLPRFTRWPMWTLDPVTEPVDHADWIITRQVHGMTMKDYFHGPLAKTDGVIEVRLGRTVSDVEDAVLIILWESADHVKVFQEAPELYWPFLRGLGLSEDASPFNAVLQYDWGGFPIDMEESDEDGIEGRITLAVVDIPYLTTNGPDRAGWGKLLAAVMGSLTFTDESEEFEDYDGGLRYTRWYSRSGACTYLAILDNEPAAGEEEENEISIAVYYLFQRWNAGPAVRKKDAALIGEPGEKERITEAISKAIPHVPNRGWRIEYWDVEVAPCCRC